MAVPAPTLKPVIEHVPDLRVAAQASRGPGKGTKIWIDLDNSPHVPFFAPIIDELEKSGYSVLVTARDCFQVCELADLLHLQYRVVRSEEHTSELQSLRHL